MQFRSISQRVFFWLLVISMLPLIGMSELFLSEFEQHTQDIEFRHLQSMSDKKGEQIQIYLDERVSDIESLAKSPFIKNSMLNIEATFDKNHIGAEDYQRADRELREYASSFLASGYYDFFLIATNGDIVFTVLQEADFATNLNLDIYSGSGLAEAYRDAVADQITHVSTFEFYPPSNESAAFLVTPLLRDGKILGLLALQIDIDKVFSVVTDNIGMGVSGETVIAREINESMDFIGPLKFKDKSIPGLKISRSSDLAMPMQKALNGEKGYGFSIDYRGADVIAVWQYLPILNWGMVVKKDTSEAFASIQDMHQSRWIMLFASLLAIILAASFVRGTIVKPIRDLTAAAREIAAGDFQRPVHVSSGDEVGQLAASFNRMAEEVGKSHLELLGKVGEAERANLAKSEFLSRMSHELRTPMNAILGFAQMLELDIEGFNEIQRENVVEILTAGRHLLYLINEVLDLARIESGNMEMSMEEVLLEDVLTQSITLVALQSEMRNITVINNFSDSSYSYSLHADYARLMQVLINLLTNAVKYNREDGAILIDGGLVSEGRLRINIKDTGCGLKAEEMDKLFTSFERLNAVENVEGTGIGLVITKHLVELMGGSIGVESVLDEGSVFWIEIGLFNKE